MNLQEASSQGGASLHLGYRLPVSPRKIKFLNATKPPISVCQSCGACCAYDREWPRFSIEDDADVARIPPHLVAPDGSGMGWTGDRCAALSGEVGAHVACTVYSDRPDVCRACVEGDDACNMARTGHGFAVIV